jgi:hypothetical protein
VIYPVSVKVPLVAGLVVSLVSASITPSISQTVEQQIIGTWETKLEGKKILFIFASPNKLFMVGSTESEEPEVTPSKLTALEFQYKINSKTKPAQFDFFYFESSPNRPDKAFTILEISQDKSLKIQLEDLQPNQPRPTSFAPNATVFTKVSNSTKLPANTVVFKPQEQIARAKESEAKTNISSVNRTQTAYRAEKAGFATTFDTLALGTLSGKRTFQTTDYTYKLLGRKDRTYVTAAAKTNGLKSYVGATFIYMNSSKQSVITSIVCETQKPTKLAPKFPRLVAGSNSIKCPKGSQPVE